MAHRNKTASSAGKLAQSAQAVYDLMRKSKRSSQVAYLLQPETKKVSDTCRSIERTIKLLSDSHQDLLEAVDRQLFQCSESVQAIKKTLDSLSGLPNIFRQTFRKSKLDINEDLPDVYRIQIQQSVTNLELCLHLIDIQINYLAAQKIDNTLITTLDTVQHTLNSQRVVVDDSVRFCAKRYLSDGTILYAKNFFEDLDIESSNDSTPNTSMIWKQSLKTTESTTTEKIETVSIADSATISPSEYCTSVADTLVPSCVQDEFDDSQNVEPDYHLLAISKEAMLENDFRKAEATLSRELRSIEMLPKQRQDARGLDEIRLLLGICAFHIHDSITARAKLISAIDGTCFSLEHVEIRCEALQHLTTIYARIRNLDQAALTCETLLRQSMRFLGKDNKVYRILALLAKIYKAQQDEKRTDAYQLIIPKECRAQLLREAEKIFLETSRSMSTSSKSSNKGSNRPETPRPPLSIDYKPTRSMQFYKQKQAMDNNILAVAWSHDSCLIAIGFNVSNRRIELRKTATEEVLHRLQIGGIAGIRCITFDRSARKLAAAFNKDQQVEETDSYVRVWSVETGQEIWNVTVLSNELRPWVCFLSFNPFNEDQLLVTCCYESCRKKEVVIYDMVSRVTVTRRTLEHAVEEAIWTKDAVALSGRLAYIEFNTRDYQQVTRDSGYRGPYTLCSGRSSSGQLSSMNANGSVRSYIKDVWTTLPLSELVLPLASVKDAYLDFNDQGTMIILMMTWKGHLCLRAPALQRWVIVAKGLSNTTILGLSRDACYAYFTTMQNDGICSLHILNVQECLKLPSSTSKNVCILLRSKN